MDLVHSAAEARERVSAVREARRTIGLVPTMGALHQGHLSLVRAARGETDFTVVSVFVNPTQFGPSEDLDAYPRTLEADRMACEREGVDLVFAPSSSEMYPRGFATYVIQERLTERLCGLSRPGHFHGVCTVVMKLFNTVRPDVAYFGQKDYQQTVVIGGIIEDMNLHVSLRVLPTVREADGLAISSRNRYLDPRQRNEAACLYRALQRAEEMVRAGETNADAVRAEMACIIGEAHGARPDYVAVVDPDELTDLQEIRSRAVAAVAVRFGSTRLIDNTILTPGEGAST